MNYISLILYHYCQGRDVILASFDICKHANVRCQSARNINHSRMIKLDPVLRTVLKCNILYHCSFTIL